jgi:hypothetical protein
MNNNKLLDDTGLSPEIRTLVIDQLSSGVEDFQLVVNKIGGKGESVAIRDEDFQILREAATNVASVLAAGTLFQAWAPAAIASLVMLLYTFRKNGITLTPTQTAVVRELKRRQAGLTAEDIALLLNIPATDVLTDLHALQEVARNDGVLVSIASVDSNGRWRAAGI